MPKRTDIKRVMLIGSGPIQIGQAAEFEQRGGDRTGFHHGAQLAERVGVLADHPDPGAGGEGADVAGLDGIAG